MKGFIEIQASKRRILVALHTIAGVADRGDKGCSISLNSSITLVNSFDVLHPEQSYDEVVELIKQAQH